MLTGIERQLNRVLAMDPDTASQLAQLAGRVIHVDLLNTGFSVYILPVEDRIQLQTEYAGEAHVTIRGTPSDMVAYMLKSGESGGGFNGTMEVKGDVGLAQNFQHIVKNLELDWEEQLAQWFGDTLGHQLGRMLRAGAGFMRNSSDKFQQDFSEYLRFERDITVDKIELAGFSREVETLRDDVERLRLRINRLRKENKEKN